MTCSWKSLLPTPAWLRIGIAPALVFMAMAADRNYLADFWHHLARGQAIVQQGRMVDQDLFTFTIPGRSFKDCNWLSQVAYYLLFERGGLDLVRLANAVVLAATLAWLVVLCRRRSGSLELAALTGVFVFLGLWQILTIRPQTFSLFLFVLVYDLLDRSERCPWLLVLVPAVLALWANLHGAFPAGLMLTGCFLLASLWRGWRDGDIFRRRQNWALGACLVAGFAATLINPYGWKIYEYVGLTSNTAAARRIDEWLPPSLDLWIGRAWLLSLLLTAGLFMVSWFKLRRLPQARDVILIGCFLPLACGSARMVAWWLIICAPLATSMLADLFPSYARRVEPNRPSWHAAVVFGVLVALVVLTLPGLQRFHPLLAARRAEPRTEERLEAIRDHLTGHLATGKVFSRFEWGEYLSWSFAPGYKIFMDGRIEIYPDEVWNQYAAVTRGQREWQKILDDYQVDILLLDDDYHARTGLLREVNASSRWQRVMRAGPASLYLRSTRLVGTDFQSVRPSP
jgi:hypothetical protein